MLKNALGAKGEVRAVLAARRALLAIPRKRRHDAAHGAVGSKGTGARGIAPGMSRRAYICAYNNRLRIIYIKTTRYQDRWRTRRKLTTSIKA